MKSTILKGSSATPLCPPRTNSGVTMPEDEDGELIEADADDLYDDPDAFDDYGDV